jgi:nitroreductase
VNFLELANTRYSVRGYENTPIEDDKLKYIFEAAHFAPSAANFQPSIFILIKSQESRQALEAVYNKKWFFQAPVIIAACCDRAVSWKRHDGKDFGDIDVAIAFDHLTLAATEQGLGTCWIGNFDSVEAKRVLKLPEHIDPIAFTPLGYPSLEKSVKIRKNSVSSIYCDFYNGQCI